MNTLATPGTAGVTAVLLLVITFAAFALSLLTRIPDDLYDIEDDYVDDVEAA